MAATGSLSVIATFLQRGHSGIRAASMARSGPRAGRSGRRSFRRVNIIEAELVFSWFLARFVIYFNQKEAINMLVEDKLIKFRVKNPDKARISITCITDQEGYLVSVSVYEEDPPEQEV